MKNTIVIIGILILLALNISAQTPVAPLYDGTIEWNKITKEYQAKLLAFAKEGKYAEAITSEFDSISKIILVENVKSRSGNVEDQVWLQGHKDGKEVNLLLKLKDLPKISDKCCILTISGYRGDSKAMTSKTKNPGLKRNPW